ncbi:hypothetical protein U1Q18_024860 [Sarracenia purpurea var. burkii]
MDAIRSKDSRLLLYKLGCVESMLQVFIVFFREIGCSGLILVGFSYFCCLSLGGWVMPFLLAVCGGVRKYGFVGCWVRFCGGFAAVGCLV